jgi:hypothetical protein
MPAWVQFPRIYEINAWVWLSELSRKREASVNLSSVPSKKWDAIASLGFDAVWLMGVWERSPAGLLHKPVSRQVGKILEEARGD